MHNRVIHVKIASDSPEYLCDFYERVFDWKIEKLPRQPDVWRLDSGEGFGINCSLFRSGEPLSAGTSAITISVTSIDTYVERVIEEGGKILCDRQLAFGNVYVYCEDPDGNVICIVEFGNSSN